MDVMATEEGFRREITAQRESTHHIWSCCTRVKEVGVGEFQHILLSNYIYLIIVKVLANRLRKV